jgi:GntR family transcriptional regulator/MocR family aminotransferase
LAVPRDSCTRYLKGAVELPDIQAGINSPAYLVNGMRSNAATVRAAACGVEVLNMDRFVLRRRDIQGVLVGFAAFTDAEIRKAVIALALPSRNKPECWSKYNKEDLTVFGSGKRPSG